MKTKFFFGGYSWSTIQVFSIFVCFLEDVSGERAQGCVGSRLNLSCSEMKVIQITAVVLGDSYGAGSFCFITDNACTHNASANHTMDVHRRCDGQSICTVPAIQEKIPCGYFISSNNDFERITYNCRDEPRIAPVVGGVHVDLRETFDETTKSPDTQHAVDTFSHSSITYENEDTDRHTMATTNAPVYVSSAILGMHGYNGYIVGVVCLIITIGIASVFAIMVQRKKRKQVRPTVEVGTIDLETNRHEVIEQNGAQRIRIETPVSHYCRLDVVDRVPRLYETLVFLDQQQ